MIQWNANICDKMYIHVYDGKHVWKADVCDKQKQEAIYVLYTCLIQLYLEKYRAEHQANQLQRSSKCINFDFMVWVLRKSKYNCLRDLRFKG